MFLPRTARSIYSQPTPVKTIGNTKFYDGTKSIWFLHERFFPVKTVPFDQWGLLCVRVCLSFAFPILSVLWVLSYLLEFPWVVIHHFSFSILVNPLQHRAIPRFIFLHSVLSWFFLSSFRFLGFHHFSFTSCCLPCSPHLSDQLASWTSFLFWRVVLNRVGSFLIDRYFLLVIWCWDVIFYGLVL